MDRLNDKCLWFPALVSGKGNNIVWAAVGEGGSVEWRVVGREQGGDTGGSERH